MIPLRPILPARARPERGARHPLLEIAHAAVAAHVRGRDVYAAVRIAVEMLPPEPAHGPRPPLSPAHLPAQSCFVSLKAHGRLRGCIGTLAPTQPSLALEIAENAMAAATRDPRFAPVAASELEHLNISIDLLSALELARSAEDLDPRRYGLVLRSGTRSGVLLPDLPQVRTAEQQIAVCREKAGLDADTPVHMLRFTVDRIGE